MPLGVKPVCSRCKNTESSMWRKDPEGEVLCHSCGIKKMHGNGGDGKSDSESSKSSNKASFSQGVQYIGPIRKSARLKPSKYKGVYNPKALATKGKSRRVIFKKNPIKAPNAVSTAVTQDYVFYDGLYWQVGDIASVMDHDGGIYYAQIRGFLQDQYCQKSAVITWLLPTQSSPKEGFDPGTYILGPEEELPRPMDCFEFVCHAPSEYFKVKGAPYDTQSNKPDLAFIWSPIGPEIRPVPTQEEIFGLRDSTAPERIIPSTRGRGKGRGRGRGRGLVAGAHPGPGGLGRTQDLLKVPGGLQTEIKTEIKEEVI